MKSVAIAVAAALLSIAAPTFAQEAGSITTLQEDGQGGIMAPFKGVKVVSADGVHVGHVVGTKKQGRHYAPGQKIFIWTSGDARHRELEVKDFKVVGDAVKIPLTQKQLMAIKGR